MIDQAKKHALIAHIRRREQSDDREILLTPESYFDGYDHNHCTICANAGAFPTSHFEARLQDVPAKARGGGCIRSVL